MISNSIAKSGETLAHDIDEARRFLKAIDPNAKGFSFQTFDDTPKKRKSLTRIMHGTLEQYVAELIRLNKAGAGIFVSVNRTDLKGRSKEHIEAIRCVYQEDDDGFDGEFPLEPNMVVESSKGKSHRYWMLDEPAEGDKAFEEAKGVEQCMVNDYGSDPSAKDVTRVLRLPGFFNMKPKYSTPRMVNTVYYDGMCWAWDDIKEAFPPPAKKPKTEPKESPASEKNIFAYMLKGGGHEEIPEGGRNTKLFGIGSAMRGRGCEYDEILTELISVNETQCSPPLGGDEVKAIARSAAGQPKGRTDAGMDHAASVDAGNLLSWTQNFTLSDEEMNKISNPEWIITNMVIQGHLIVIVAEPNGGKTTILMHLSGEMAAAGYQVFYVNADTSGGDAKPMHADAREKNFSLMLPDMASGGLSMADVVDHLARMNAVPDADYSKVVFVFDTLKKMTSVISKAKSGKLYKLLRSLSSKGMTIILLAHTNKYKADDGTPIYEGTGDLRADVDELIYLIPEKQEDKSMIVTTSPDKVRGAFEPITYEIDADRNVKLLEEVVDTAKHREMRTKQSRDRTTIDAIDIVIDTGHISQKALVDACNTDHGIKEHTARRVLKAYSILILPDMVNVIRRPAAGQLWGMRRTGVNNRIEYSKLPQKSAESLWEE